MYNNGFVVAIKINDKTVNESNGRVVLPFDSEYSLMLKNRNDRKAVARVYIDGEEVTKTGRLVLDANSSLNLERYIEDNDTGRKFKFVPLSHNAVKDKGDSEKGYVEVHFQLVKPTHSQVIIHEEHIWRRRYHDYWDYPRPFYHELSPYEINDPIKPQVFCTTRGTSSGLSENTLYATSNSGDKIQFGAQAYEKDNQLVEEVGATIKGSNSHQKFSYSYVGELEAQETVVRFQLVGTKDEKVAAHYLKSHCTQCGKRYESQDNFCGKCGVKK